MTSRAYRREGKERARRVRKEKRGKEKAGPATMTSRAYKRGRNVEKIEEGDRRDLPQ